MLKPDHPKGTLDLEADPDGNIWVGMMYQGGMARFDRKTEQFRIYPMPEEWQTDATQQSHFSVAGMKVDGKVWVKNSDRSQVMKLDPETGEYENLGSFKIPSNGRPIGIYGIYADQQNNAYILEFGNGGIGKIDAKTGAMAFYPTPTPFSRARRGRVECRTGCGSRNSAATASPCSIRRPRRSPSGRSRSRGSRPTTWWPTERRGLGGQRILRPARPARSQDRRMGQLSAAALLATSAGRSSTTATPPVKVWVGNNHAASVIKLEPLD